MSCENDIRSTSNKATEYLEHLLLIDITYGVVDEACKCYKRHPKLQP